MSAMTRLPTELVIRVVRELHDGLSFPDPRTRSALCSLCSTSRLFHELTIPLLYSHIRLAFPEESASLAASPHVSTHLKHLSIHTSGPIIDPPMVRVRMSDLCSLLAQVRDTLHTLILNIPFQDLFMYDDRYEVRQIFRSRLEGLTCIETAASGQGQFVGSQEMDRNYSSPSWSVRLACPKWMLIRRLYLHDIMVDKHFADECASLPYLENLVLYRSSYDRHYVGMAKLVERKTHDDLPLVIIDYHRGWTKYSRRYMGQLDALAETHTNLRILDPPEAPFKWPRWIQEGAETGDLWNL